MTAKGFAFGDAFDAAYVVGNYLFVECRTHFLVNMFMDSKQLFDAVTEGQQMTEKRLMIDV